MQLDSSRPGVFTFLDVGAAQNRPASLVAAYVGCRAIGVETCNHHMRKATLNTASITTDPIIENCSVTYFHEDSTVRSNWSGVGMYFVWDAAFDTKTFNKTLNIIYWAHQKPVLLVVCTKHTDITRDIKDLFEAEEIGKRIQLPYLGGTSTSTVQVYRIKKKVSVLRYEIPPPHISILDKAEESFFSPKK